MDFHSWGCFKKVVIVSPWGEGLALSHFIIVRKWSLKLLPVLSRNLTGFCFLLKPVQLQVLVAPTLYLQGFLHSGKMGVITGARIDWGDKLNCS